jgi:hypothetical protein
MIPKQVEQARNFQKDFRFFQYWAAVSEETVYYKMEAKRVRT